MGLVEMCVYSVFFGGDFCGGLVLVYLQVEVLIVSVSIVIF